jgi:hypothetical protein
MTTFLQRVASTGVTYQRVVSKSKATDRTVATVVREVGKICAGVFRGLKIYDLHIF